MQYEIRSSYDNISIYRIQNKVVFNLLKIYLKCLNKSTESLDNVKKSGAV